MILRHLRDDFRNSILYFWLSDELFDAGARALKTPHDQLSFLADSLRADPRDFFLVFHNIDGVNLRKEKTQQVGWRQSVFLFVIVYRARG